MDLSDPSLRTALPWATESVSCQPLNSSHPLLDVRNLGACNLEEVFLFKCCPVWWGGSDQQWWWSWWVRRTLPIQRRVRAEPPTDSWTGHNSTCRHSYTHTHTRAYTCHCLIFLKPSDLKKNIMCCAFKWAPPKKLFLTSPKPKSWAPCWSRTRICFYNLLLLLSLEKNPVAKVVGGGRESMWKQFASFILLE